MKKATAWGFSLLMLLFSAVYLALFAINMDLRQTVANAQDDIRLELAKTRKQQQEYDEYSTQLPPLQAQGESILPQAAAANAAIETQKAERKALRNQIDEAQTALTALELPDIAALEAQYAAIVGGGQ